MLEQTVTQVSRERRFYLGMGHEEGWIGHKIGQSIGQYSQWMAINALESDRNSSQRSAKLCLQRLHRGSSLLASKRLRNQLPMRWLS